MSSTTQPARLLAALVLVVSALSVDCGPPPRDADDLWPCTMMRLRVCGANDECLAGDSDTQSCQSCKAGLCARFRALEDNNEQGLCFVEWRSRHYYPLCRQLAPLPTIPPPPFVTNVECERECSLVPYPPAPPRF